jgi:hypothetical protein
LEIQKAFSDSLIDGLLEIATWCEHPSFREEKEWRMRAQLLLVPGKRSTHPASGTRGDLYADSTGRLWFCKTSGAKATWRQIA